MFKKHKQLVVGFLLGALIFGVVPVSATVQEYILQKSQAKIIVDGKEFSNAELPVLNYKGYNYIPASTFREICDKIEVGFKWVGEKNEIQISTNKKIDTIKSNKDVVTNTTKDGFNITVINGTEYIAPREIHEYFIDNDTHYKIEYSSTAKSYNIYYKENIILANIPSHLVYQGTGYIEYSYFNINIAPLIK